MNLRQRIEQLENLLGSRRGLIVVVHSRAGRVAHGRFEGMQLEEVERQFADNDILINVVRSQAEIKNGDTM